MARPKELVDPELAEQARAALGRVRNHKLCLRLQAIVSCGEHPVKTVAGITGVSRQTLWRWIKRFRWQGIAGLYDRPKGHTPPKLNEEQRERVAGWLAEGRDSRGEPVHWTLWRLAAEIKKQFGVSVGITSLWRVVRALGFRQKVPRPFHTKADPQAQQEFKKNG